MKKTLFTALSLLLFAELQAATENLTGFDVGSTIEATQTNGAFSIQTSVVRTGSYALRTNPNTTGSGWFDFRGYNPGGTGTAINGNTIFLRFYFRYATKPAALSEPIIRSFSQNFTKLELRINSDGNLVAYDTGLVSLATGTTVLAQDTWYRINVEINTGATAAYEVLVDGVSDMSGTGDLSTEAHRGVEFGKTNRNGNSVDFFYDDIIISDSAQPSAGAVKTMLPNANGTYQDFTVGAGVGDHYTLVNETPNDGDTSYLVSTLSAGEAETFALEDTATVGISGTINAVKAMAIVKRDGAANGTVEVRIRSASTDSDNGGAQAGVAYVDLAHILDTDPATGTTWLVSALDSVETGVQEDETTDRTRLTRTSIQVDYTPAAAGGLKKGSVVIVN